MDNRFDKYPEYKNTDFPWVEEIPSHWKLQRLDRLFHLRNEPPQEGDERITAYLDGRVTLRTNVPGQKIKGVIKEAGWQRIYRGDFAISGMNAHIGGMGVSDSLGKCSPMYLVLRPKDGTNAKFISHVVRYLAHTGALKILVNTIRFNSADFKRDDLKNILVWLPPLDEQQAIVRCLDHTDRLIRRYIRAKQKQIKLLEEQKQAIIHQAVTRGLNPDVHLKSSGIEWLGIIPKHWDVDRLRNVVQLIVSNVDKLKFDDEIPVKLCNYVDVYKNDLITQNINFMAATASAEEIRQFRLHFNDVLITKDSEMWNDIGVPALVKYEADNLICGYHLAILRPRFDSLTGDYLFWLLHSISVSSQFYISANGVTRYGLSHLAIKNVVLPIPPLAEQKLITTFLDTTTASINQTIDVYKREINLFKEYHTRLIADVVTGKLDVREAAGRLPAEEVDQALKIDEELSSEDEEEQEEMEPADLEDA